MILYISIEFYIYKFLFYKIIISIYNFSLSFSNSNTTLVN